MWTGKSGITKVVAAPFLAAALGACASSTPSPGRIGEPGTLPDAAWWYDLQVEPRSGEVRGIPIGEFDTDWAAATTLEDGELTRAGAAGGVADLRNSGLAFVAAQDLDRDGIAEEVFVGTYETRDGSRGRFLAVSSGGRVLRHFVHPGSAGFSALLPVGDGVRWYKCLECGEFELLRWSGGAYVLE